MCPSQWQNNKCQCIKTQGGHFTSWISPSLRDSAERTHRPQGVIIVGIYMSSNIIIIIIITDDRILNFPECILVWDFPLGKCPQFSRA